MRSSQTVTRAEEIDRKTGRFWAALEVAMLPVEKAPYHEPVDLKHDESLSRLLIALNLSAVFIAVFLVRCYLGADLTSLAVEMVAMLVMFCTTYALFLAWSYGETMAYQFLTCVALEWLFCSDNTLNMFGWYVTSDVQLGKILQMIGFGVVVQAVRSFLKHLSDRRRSSERLVVVSIVLDVFGWPRRSNGYSRFNWPQGEGI